MSLGLGLGVGKKKALAPAPVLSGTLPNPTNGVAYSQSLTLTGGQTPVTYSISAGSLPAGLTLNTSTGVISGTPTGFGAASFTVTVTDAVGRTSNSAQTPTVFGPELWPGFGAQTFSTQRTTSTWTANAATTLNNFYVPVAGSTLFDYQCTTAGTNGATEPTWPTVAGQTVTSGTAVYTAVTKMMKVDSNGGYWTAANNLGSAQSTGIATVDGATYRVVYTLSGYVGGSFKILVYGATTAHSAITTQKSANGTYTEDVVASSAGSFTGQIRLQATGTSGTNTYTITAVSVRRVG